MNSSGAGEITLNQRTSSMGGLMLEVSRGTIRIKFMSANGTFALNTTHVGAIVRSKHLLNVGDEPLSATPHLTLENHIFTIHKLDMGRGRNNVSQPSFLKLFRD